nr:3-oxoacyl-[acyl-carrier-protein] synthase I, chloroplastic-like [Ipomoea batatas]
MNSIIHLWPEEAVELRNDMRAIAKSPLLEIKNLRGTLKVQVGRSPGVSASFSPPPPPSGRRTRRSASSSPGWGSYPSSAITWTPITRSSKLGRAAFAIDRFDASKFPTRFGGQIQGFKSEGYIDGKNDMRLDDCLRYCIVAGKKADLKVDGIGKVRVRSDPIEPPNNPHMWSARGSPARAGTRLRLRRLGPLRL